MKNSQILKTARGLVTSVITMLTPPVLPTMRGAYATLEKALARAKAADATDVLPEEFQMSIQSVIDQLDSFRSGVASNMADFVTKSYSRDGFGHFVNTEITKALSEPNGVALRRMFNLLKSIKAAEDSSIAKGASFETSETISVSVQNDPAAFTETSTEGSVTAQDTGGTTLATSAAPGPAAVSTMAAPASVGKFDVAKEMTEAAAKIEKARTELPDTGWAMDLNSPEFLHGIRKADFGRDREPAKA